MLRTATGVTANISTRIALVLPEGATVRKSALQRASLIYEKDKCATLALGVNGVV
jgi:hypothetical protein